MNVAENAQSSILERQRALLGLAKVDVSAAYAAIVELATKLAEGKLEPALQLDMIEAGTLNGSAEVAELINRFKQQQSDGGLLSQHLVSLEGGDAERGRSLFVGHRVAQCVRCHKAGTLIPGGNAGPDLAQVARRHPRLALLQSLVEPSALIARGFESVTLVLDSGNIVAGVIRNEADGMVTIEQPDGRIVTVKTEEIEERTPARSAMPEMHRTLTPREMRDLVEFLSTLQ
jgi:quinoprotein glucose dehydrogenase